LTSLEVAMLLGPIRVGENAGARPSARPTHSEDRVEKGKAEAHPAEDAYSSARHARNSVMSIASPGAAC
jgi:hypothetical protein